MFIKDTDERACAYIAGAAPNRWGLTADGRDLGCWIEQTRCATGKLSALVTHVFILCLAGEFSMKIAHLSSMKLQKF